jgi:serine/threonine protein kinase
MLGKGSFASVYVGKQESTSDSVAVKILSKDSSKYLIIKFKRISISKLQLKTKSLYFNNYIHKILLVSMMSWKAAKIITLYNNFAKETSRKILSRDTGMMKLKR